ncbi:NADH-quinone oxidoreductase subunit J [Novosphingobium sp. MW5]|nr:NADH-quinone oxidoreductase subunit J [Novosphingobium sp. MW5]
MMLDVDFAELRQGFLQYMPIGALIGLILLVEILMGLGARVIAPEMLGQGAEPTPALSTMSNVQALGSVLYTKYIYFFQVAGPVLLVAMIGAIVLTLRHKPNVKRHDIPTADCAVTRNFDRGPEGGDGQGVSDAGRLRLSR